MKLFTKYLLILLAGLVVISCSVEQEEQKDKPNTEKEDVTIDNKEDMVSNSTMNIKGEISKTIDFNNPTLSTIMNTSNRSDVALSFEDPSNSNTLDIAFKDIKNLEENVPYEIYTFNKYFIEDNVERGASILTNIPYNDKSYRFDAQEGTLTLTEIKRSEYCKGIYDIKMLSNIDNIEISVSGNFEVYYN